ncbi:MAG: HD domain-containing phosphohydrolase [Desulfobacterales bacterium]
MNMTPDETILFVDDEENILEVASEYFGYKGYHTLTARNGIEATRILKTERVDCVFSDINMPEMDGLQLAEYIHELDSTIPVIMMTGYPSLENTLATLKNGVVDFLIKPVNLEQMELALRRVLRQRRMFVENLLLQKELRQKEKIERLNRELVHKVEELNLLNRIMHEFAGIGSTTNAFRVVVDMAVEAAHAHAATFLMVNENVTEPFEVASSARKGFESLLKLSAMDGARRLIAEVARDQTPLLISEPGEGARLSPDFSSAMLVPMTIRNRVFGVLIAANFEEPVHFSEKDLFYLSFITESAARSIENLALYENIYQNLFSTLFAFVNALEARDLYTRQHSSRVARIAVMIGRSMGCSQEDLDILNFSGHLHDIGKIGIRDGILLKSTSLTQEEYEIIKTHPIIGANIIGQLGLWDREREIIRSHHEHFDGTGYPDGLSGEAIPLLSRILSVADFFDAMASGRAYRRKMNEERVIEMIRDRSGTHFDPVVVDTMIRLFTEGRIPRIAGT